MRRADPPLDGMLLRGHMATLVLAVLRDGPAHGYSIVQEVRRRSRNAVQFRQGTLYPLLHDLERSGFVVSAWEPIPGDSGTSEWMGSEPTEGEKMRRVYTITEDGRTELLARTKTWQRLAEAMEDVLAHPGEGAPAGFWGASG